MSKCRACFKPAKAMIPFDDKSIFYFNILTSLNLQMSTEDPQKLCKQCFKTIQQFIEFRKKCIAASAVFSDIILKKDIKQEVTDYLIEVKVETNLCDQDDTTDHYNITKYEIPCVKKTGDDKEQNQTYEKTLKIENTKNKEKTLNKNQRGLSCGLCSNTFEDNAQLHTHIPIHRDSKYCSVCKEKFEDWQEMLAHRLKHLPDTTKLHQCHLCPCKRKGHINMEFHFRTKHHTNGERQTLRCRTCDRYLKSPKLLQTHTADIHSSSNKQYYCDFCNKLFHFKSSLRPHIARHMNLKKIPCDMCDYVANFSTGLKTHKLFKHNPARAYCRECGKSFESSALKEQHKCKGGTTVCPVCGKTIFKRLVKEHIQTHSSTPRYGCDLCSARFRAASNARAHRDKHDGVPRYACSYCPKRFYSRPVLYKHERIHTGIKPYVCEVCQKAFTGNNNLKVHMKVHGKHLIKKRSENEEGCIQ